MTNRTPRTPRTLITAGLAVGLLITVSACGSSDSGGADEASTGNFCEVYNDVNAAGDDAPEALLTADLDQLVATAPNDELRQAAEVVRNAITSIDAVDVDNLDVDDPTALAEAEAALAQVFTPQFIDAADQLDDYADANCS